MNLPALCLITTSAGFTRRRGHARDGIEISPIMCGILRNCCRVSGPCSSCRSTRTRLICASEFSDFLSHSWVSVAAKTLPAQEIENAVWAQLQNEAIDLASLDQLVERISYDGVTRRVSMTLREGMNCA